MESNDSKQDQALIKSDFADDSILDSSSKAIDKTPSDIGMILQEGDEAQGQKHNQKPNGEETTDAVDENIAELQLQLNIESNASLNVTVNPGNFDYHDNQCHAFDLNFPANDPEKSPNIDVLGYDCGGELKEPCMEENNIRSNLHAGFNEDNGLDLELKIGLSSGGN